jgi:hypothetical protein
MSKQPDKHLVDDAVDAYVDWREECLGVRDAYDRWTHAPKVDAASAFAAYRAALDREERASEIYAGLIGRVAVCKRASPNPVAPALRALRW